MLRNEKDRGRGQIEIAIEIGIGIAIGAEKTVGPGLRAGVKPAPYTMLCNWRMFYVGEGFTPSRIIFISEIRSAKH